MNSPLIKALGATLFHFLWEGLAIALLFASCRAKPAARYRLACVAMFAMPAVFFATFLILLPENASRFPVFTGFAALTEAATLPSTHTGAVSVLERAQAAMRWFVPFWLAGMALFCLRNLLGWTAAPATWPDFNASAKAASSTRPPRAQLMIRTPFFVLAMASRDRIFLVASVSGVCTVMKSARASSVSRSAFSTPRSSAFLSDKYGS